MEMFEYPAIYKEADGISNKTQRNYLICLKIYFGLLIISGIIIFAFNNILWLKIANAIISIAILIFSAVFLLYNFQGIWYSARAVAESIKTLSWRYALRVDPFNSDDEAAQEMLIERMKQIVKMNHAFQENIKSTFSMDKAIPESMQAMRSMNVVERRDFYHKFRVKEQQDWYYKKAKYNTKMSNLFFSALIFTSLIITVLLFVDIGYHQEKISPKLPINILISIVSILFTWIQTKKYKELHVSYALTAHEIGFISFISSKSCTEKDLNEYVMNAETAFSREHTQWLARIDASQE